MVAKVIGDHELIDEVEPENNKELKEFIENNNFKILLVDDKEVNLMVFEEMLLNLNCEVVTAYDGKQAIEASKK
ncbi:MAG: hypothetical protein HRT71_09990 [Flavobacteriales bacterium]|nr:hypothetical protein [Flavobacteriales bacterium]